MGAKTEILTNAAPSLGAAFAATDYRVAATPRLRLRVGAQNRAAGRLLARWRVSQAIWITADNPDAVRQPGAANAIARGRLRRWLCSIALPAAPGTASSADWPTEHGWLIGGVAPEQAERLAQALGQLAWLRLGADGGVALRWRGKPDNCRKMPRWLPVSLSRFRCRRMR